MVKKVKDQACCPDEEEQHRVEAIISVDERGQTVLPKSIRERFDLRPGDKLALVTKERDGKVCCLYLFKATDLMATVKDRFGPLLEEGR
ncbi:MAG: AbrB/MazE/SpoVT family DNA-binding domain-containing protein [Methanomassiliicoccus sp.]|nr:AbrB/MazE/SpoVT family DNA-binding domain-containing protein [Methanomassiliicoccus sp.]